MRTMFDVDEDEEVETRASEITLGTTSLLGIFFGLVLVCGVFFGFGYSLGRGTAWVSQAKSVDSPSTVKEDVASVTPPPASAPVAAQTEQPQQTEQTEQTDPDPAPTAKQTVESVPQDTPAPPAVNRKPSPGREMVAYQPPVDTPAPVATGSDGKPMVQIAAVARPQDAYTLVSALRQHGYAAVMRTDPQDKLVHVQVGPFADRNQATVMKQKLLADGYNAIIKQ